MLLSIWLFGWIAADDETTTKPTLTSTPTMTIKTVETVKVIKRDPIVTRTSTSEASPEADALDVDSSNDGNVHEESSIEAEIPDHGGDTKIVQNNYNMSAGGWHRWASSEAFTFISGVLLIIILLLGITILAIVLVKLVNNGEGPGKPMLVPPPMGVHWRNDLDYSLGGQFGGPPPPPDHVFSEQPLHPAKKML